MSGAIHLTKDQRINLLKASYYKSRYSATKQIWVSPSQLQEVPGDGIRGPIQFSSKHFTGTDGWGATLAQPTMDNLSGFGCNVGISGFSAKHGYCGTNNGSVGYSCKKEEFFPTTTPLPELPNIATITSAFQYRQEIYKKYGNNPLYCDGCVTNSENDPHFINHNDGFFFKN
tara:strand:+ start:6267 stop:6782 length:516 start_codon:yes stop_codon:yes gene_type:complete